MHEQALPDVTGLVKSEPYKHQTVAMQHSVDRPYYGIFAEQGTGKTLITLGTIKYQYDNKKIDSVIILAPDMLHLNWAKKEIPKHFNMPEGSYLTAVWLSNMGKKAMNRWNAVANYRGPELTILMANIEAINTARFRASVEAFMENRRVMFVIDEATCIKNPKAERSKWVFKLGQWAVATRALTGTPITQGALDLWAVCHFLSPTALPFPSFVDFKARFAIEQMIRVSRDKELPKVVGFRDLDVLTELLKPFTMRVLKKDCLDLPDKIYQTIYVELTDEQRRIYNSFAKLMFAQIGTEIVTVSSALTKMLKLQQVVLGWLPAPDGDYMSHPTEIQSNRLKVLGSVVEKLTTPFIVFCRFRLDTLRVEAYLREEHGIACSLYTGGESPKQKQDSEDEFTSGKTRAFIATKAGARGLTLVNAETVIYYSQDHSLETRLQSEDRAHRIGQKKNVLYIDLVAEGTVDETISQALLNKHELSKAVLDTGDLSRIFSEV